MPLEAGSSRAAISANIKTEIPALKKRYPDKSDEDIRKQAIAIALRKSREFSEDFTDDELMSAYHDKYGAEPDDDEDEGGKMTSGACHPNRFLFRLAPPPTREVRNGYVIYPNSILFKAGKFPKRNFPNDEITNDQVANMAASFDAHFVNSETNLMHTDVLKPGAALRLFRVWVDRDDPAVLRGEVGVPVALDAMLNKKTLSIELHPRSLDRIVGLAIDPNPAVPQASLMSKKGSSMIEKTIHAQRNFQQMHDIVHQHVMGPPTNTGYEGYEQAGRYMSAGATFSSPKEFGHYQAIHEECVQAGATCTLGAPNQVVMSSGKKGGLMARFSSLKALFGLKEKATSEEEVKVIDDIIEQISGDAEPAARREHAAATLQSVDFSQTAAGQQVAALQEQLAETEARLQRLDDDARERRADERIRREAEISREAAQFADALVKDARYFPKEVPTLVSMYKQAAQDDERYGRKVTFSVGDKQVEGTRIDQLKALVAQRPKHTYFGQTAVVDPAQGHMLLSNGAEAKDSDEAKATASAVEAALMSTAEGRAALALKKEKSALFAAPGTNGHSR